MASHFSALGLFDPELTLDAVLAGTPVDVVTDASGAVHSRFVDASGAAVIAHATRGGDVVCVTPFFHARSPALWRIRAGAVCVDASCVHCTGVDVDIYDAEHPMAALDDAFVSRATLQLVHGRAFAEDATGRIVDRAVVAFAHQVRTFTDVDAFHAAGGVDGLRYAVPSFMPFGMFGPADDVGQRATAQLVGRVLSAVTRVNTVARAPFLHLVVEGLWGAIDVVADAREVQEPTPGSVVEVQAWLVADDRG